MPAILILIMGNKKMCPSYLEKHISNSIVGILGLEPRMTGPESVVLPLHHIPIRMQLFVFAMQSYIKNLNYKYFKLLFSKKIK